jgi:hypothetical protein
MATKSNKMQHGAHPKSLMSRVNLLVFFFSLLCIPSFGQDGEQPVLVFYKIISNDAQVYITPGHDKSDAIGKLQKGQIIYVDSLQIDDGEYLPVVVDYLENDWAERLCKEYYDSDYYTGDLWYGYVKSSHAEKVGQDKKDSREIQLPSEAIQSILYIAGIICLIFFFWLAAKSKKGEIIIYQSWSDAFLTLAIGGVSLFVALQYDEIIGALLIIASFVWSSWISIKRNKQKTKFFGIIIGIARMLIIYLLIAMAIIAWAAMLSKREMMQQAGQMRRSSERTTKAKNDKIREAEMAGIIAAIGFAVLGWLTVSFIHTEKDKRHQDVINNLKIKI